MSCHCDQNPLRRRHLVGDWLRSFWKKTVWLLSDHYHKYRSVLSHRKGSRLVGLTDRWTDIFLSVHLSNFSKRYVKSFRTENYLLSTSFPSPSTSAHPRIYEHFLVMSWPNELEDWIFIYSFIHPSVHSSVSHWTRAKLPGSPLHVSVLSRRTFARHVRLDLLFLFCVCPATSYHIAWRCGATPAAIRNSYLQHITSQRRNLSLVIICWLAGWLVGELTDWLSQLVSCPLADSNMGAYINTGPVNIICARWMTGRTLAGNARILSITCHAFQLDLRRTVTPR